MVQKQIPLEKNFKKKVKKQLDSIEDLYYFVKEAAALRAIPDIIGCYKGKFFAWELKRSEDESRNGSPRHALQKYIISQINKAGGESCFVYPENFEEKLQKLLNYSIFNEED